MKTKEELKNIRNKDLKTLYLNLEDEYKNIHKLKFSIKFKNVRDHSKVSKSRKKIARILTVISEKINKEG